MIGPIASARVYVYRKTSIRTRPLVVNGDARVTPNLSSGVIEFGGMNANALEGASGLEQLSANDVRQDPNSLVDRCVFSERIGEADLILAPAIGVACLAG